MSVYEKSKEELRLAIALLKGYQPMHTLYGIKLMKPLPQQSSFSPMRNVEAPDWPNDIAASMRLVKEYESPDSHFVLTRSGTSWRCEIQQDGCRFTATGDSAEVAICRVFLLANDAESE